MQRTRAGYTIIEIMVVLAVWTITFFAAVALFAGKQGKTEFSQSMREAQSRIQSVVNDVGVSLFTNAGSYDCKLNGGRPSLSTVTAGTGTNEDCIFLGKAVQIDNESDPNQFIIYTVLGARAPRGNALTSVTEANFTDFNPQPFTINGGVLEPDLREFYTIPFQATVLSAHTDKDTGPNTQTYLAGFYNGQQSASQQGSLSLLSLGYVGFETKNNPGAPGEILSSIQSNVPFRGVTIKTWTLCFQSGTSDEMAKLIVNASVAGITADVSFGDCS